MTHIIFTGFTVLLAASAPAFAAPPEVRTPSPVIHLADNLDEADYLGWCIDTQGRGFGERLHAHSCKPQGGDVQFRFEAETGLIRSVEYPRYCMAFAPSDATTFALLTCDVNSQAQQFFYQDGTGEITLANDRSLCITVGNESRSAGPFMSRSLDLSLCADTSEVLKHWVVKL